MFVLQWNANYKQPAYWIDMHNTFRMQQLAPKRYFVRMKTLKKVGSAVFI